MRIEWSQSAVASLDAIATYLNQFSAEYSKRMVVRLTTSVRPLRRFPRMGRVVPEYDVETIREVIIVPYRVIYQIGSDRIEVLNIVHGARQID